MGHIYLGVDIGTTSAKCLAVGEDGRVLAFARQGYPMTHPHPGWAEQDPEDYWRALVATVRECVDHCGRNGQPSDSIVALALSTQGDTLVVTDKLGKPLLPAISWMDTRGSEEHAQLLAEAGAAFWYEQTGIPFTVISSACSIRWVQNHRPDVMAAGPVFCYVPDYLAHRLTGIFATDAPSASWSRLFRTAKREWSGPVLDLLGIDAVTLPEVRESGVVIGELSPEAAEKLGLRSGVRLMAGAFDQAAAAHGAGGRGVLSCGTAWVLYTIASQPVTDPRGQLCTCCHAVVDQWGTVLPFSGGTTYDWVSRTVPVEAGALPSSAEPLVFIPHLYGGLSPDWRTQSKGSILGLTLSHTAADIREAVMRGLACETRRNLDAAEPLCGKMDSVRMVGGAGKSETWPEIIANLLDRAVEVSDCVESACYGAAKLAAGDSWDGVFGLRKFEPDAQAVETEERNYQRYLAFYRALVDIYEADC